MNRAQVQYDLQTDENTRTIAQENDAWLAWLDAQERAYTASQEHRMFAND